MPNLARIPYLDNEGCADYFFVSGDTARAWGSTESGFNLNSTYELIDWITAHGTALEYSLAIELLPINQRGPYIARAIEVFNTPIQQERKDMTKEKRAVLQYLIYFNKLSGDELKAKLLKKDSSFTSEVIARAIVELRDASKIYSDGLVNDFSRDRYYVANTDWGSV